MRNPVYFVIDKAKGLNIHVHHSLVRQVNLYKVKEETYTEKRIIYNKEESQIINTPLQWIKDQEFGPKMLQFGVIV